MYTPEQILGIVNLIVAKGKDVITKKTAGKYQLFNNKGELNIPDYYPCYREAVEQAMAISYHTEHGKFPDALFLKSTPNQTQEEFNYLKSTYKQSTTTVFLDLISILQRPLNDMNWSIEYREDEEQYKEKGLQHYVENEIKHYGSLENYFRSLIPAIKTANAEAVIAIKPERSPYLKNEDDSFVLDEADNMTVTDELIDPQPYYYPVANIVGYSPDNYYVIETYERSLVEYSGKIQPVGMVYEFYDEMNIWKIKQVGKFVDFKFEVEIYFNHNWDKIPVHKMMGVPYIKQDRLIWQSPFLAVTPILDNVAINLAYLQVSIRTCVYPYKIMVGDVCEFEDPVSHQPCSSGQIFDIVRSTAENRQIYNTCPSCNGMGLKSRMSTGGVMLLKPKTREDDGDSTFSQAPLQYVNPSTETLDFIEKKSASDIEKAYRILHMNTSNSDVKGSENMTATGMVIDQKAQYAFIQPQIQQLFQLYEFTMDAIGYMRYGQFYQKPTITYPQNFDLVTEEDVLIKIGEAIKLKLPPFIIRVYLEKFLRAMYFNESHTSKILDLIVNVDRVLTLSDEDLMLKQRNGDVEKWEVYLHDSSISIIRGLIEEDDKFMDLDLETQKKKVIETAKANVIEVPDLTSEITGGGLPTEQ